MGWYPTEFFIQVFNVYLCLFGSAIVKNDAVLAGNFSSLMPFYSAITIRVFCVGCCLYILYYLYSLLPIRLLMQYQFIGLCIILPILTQCHHLPFGHKSCSHNIALTRTLLVRLNMRTSSSLPFACRNCLNYPICLFFPSFSPFQMPCILYGDYFWLDLGQIRLSCMQISFLRRVGKKMDVYLHIY